MDTNSADLLHTNQLAGEPATSLSRMHDIVLPDPVSWWPLAPGWYVLASLLLVGLIITLLGLWRRYRGNAYRRQAATVLADLGRKGPTQDSASALMALLKRTALSTFPRAEVASLNGQHWWQWLDECGNGTRFASGIGQQCEQLAYGKASAEAANPETWAQIVEAAAGWIRTHARYTPGEQTHAPGSLPQTNQEQRH